MYQFQSFDLPRTGSASLRTSAIQLDARTSSAFSIHARRRSAGSRTTDVISHVRHARFSTRCGSIFRWGTSCVFGGSSRATSSLPWPFSTSCPDGVTLDGQPRQCQAHTRRGTPCQRDPLPSRDYCPSHKHLEETFEAAEVPPSLGEVDYGDSVSAAARHRTRTSGGTSGHPGDVKGQGASAKAGAPCMCEGAHVGRSPVPHRHQPR